MSGFAPLDFAGSPSKWETDPGVKALGHSMHKSGGAFTERCPNINSPASNHTKTPKQQSKVRRNSGALEAVDLHSIVGNHDRLQSDAELEQSKLRSELQVLKTEHEQLNTRCVQAHKELACEKEHASSELATLKSEYSALSREHEAVKLNAAQAAAELCLVKERHVAVAGAKAALVVELDARRAECKELQCEVEKTRLMAATEQKSVAESLQMQMEATKGKCEAELHRMGQQLEAMRAEKEVLRSEKESLEDEAQTVATAQNMQSPMRQMSTSYLMLQIKEGQGTAPLFSKAFDAPFL